MNTILIGYASVHGSTAEIAHYIGQILTEKHFSVSVQSVTEIKSLDQYAAFVLGAPVQTGMWLKPMLSFMHRYRETLITRPVFAWMTCVRILEPGGFDHAMQHYVPPDLYRLSNLRDLQIFPGRLRPEDLNNDERWTIYLRYDGAEKMESLKGDFRDWGHIKEWAEYIAEQLEKAKS
jgi:menaquinone-dependent protoporphyrinogen oxidase